MSNELHAIPYTRTMAIIEYNGKIEFINKRHSRYAVKFQYSHESLSPMNVLVDPSIVHLYDYDSDGNVTRYPVSESELIGNKFGCIITVNEYGTSRIITKIVLISP